MPPSANAIADRKKSLSAILRELIAIDNDKAVTIGEITDRFGRRSFGALMFVFAALNCLPLPPGGTSVLGLPLLLLAPQVAIGIGAPWLPRKFRDRRVKGTDLDKAFGKVLPRLESAEKFCRPRLTFLFGPVGDRIIGLVCTLLAMVLILPIPLGNFAPAIAIGLFSLALFNRDGVLALTGYAFTAFSAGLLVVSAGAVTLAIQKLLHFFGA